MFDMIRPVPRVHVPPTTARPPSGKTPLRLPITTPYLPYLLFDTHRLDLLTAMRVRDGRPPVMPPLC